jgi:hypothetical protein
MRDTREYMAKLLVERGGFKDLDEPVILAGGLLGVYFANAETYCLDGKGIVDFFGFSAVDMIDEVWRVYNIDELFRTVVDSLTERIVSVRGQPTSKTLISGGQRRDWVFSGPVARKLGLDHIALYKDGSAQRISPKGDVIEITDCSVLSGYSAIPVVDMLTEGSSCYSWKSGKETGWVPRLRAYGAQVDHLFTVLSRLQGGEENLKRQAVDVTALLELDEEFLAEVSNQPDIAIAYLHDPIGESERYIKKHGVEFLVPYFAPEHSKPEKAAKFLARFGKFLRREGFSVFLEERVRKKHDTAWGFVGR